MLAPFVSELNAQFAKLTAKVFIDMAVRTCENLGITDFILVPSDKDLNSSEIHFVDNVRYRKTARGEVIIHSIAMQQICVSHGFPRALPWVQNVCNPRLVCRLEGGRVWAQVRKSLLARCGDVESNPGPTLPHPHVCFKCRTIYVHTHGGAQEPHGQFMYQCPNPSCLVYFGLGSDEQRVNPTGSVSLQELASAHRMLLMLSGDVESNPGPYGITQKRCFLTVVVIVVGLWFRSHPEWSHPSFPREIGYIAYSATEKPLVRDITVVMVTGAVKVASACSAIASVLVMPVENHIRNVAIVCAHTEANRLEAQEAWRGTLTGPWMFVFNAVGLVPDYADTVAPSFFCEMIFVVHRPEIIHQQYTIVWLTKTCAIFFTCSVAAMLSLFCSWSLWFFTRRHGKTEVVNHNKGLDINPMKDSFRREFDGVVMPSGRGHIGLATQRRLAEGWCINQLLARFERYRDVGGSRTRWIDLGYQKHICAPVTCNDDILREEKSCGQFENCGMVGQCCPKRYEIPAAILSHVDYYMTQEEMVATITGPTFIINHDFRSRPEQLGVGKHGAEALVEVTDGLVHMTTSDGCAFTHEYHQWANEGSVVGRNGAFQYVTIGKLADTRVLYCVPAHGVYNRKDNNALPVSNSTSVVVGGGYVARYDTVTSDYVFNGGLDTFRVPAALIIEAATTFMTAPRDAKFTDTVRSFVSGKLRAHNLPLTHVDKVIRCVVVISDRKAIEDLPALGALAGNPKEFNIFDRLFYRIRMAIRDVVPSIDDYVSAAVMRCPGASKIAPWMFSTIKVPTYQVNVEMRASRHASGRAVEYNVDKFRPQAAPVDASRGQRGSGRAREELHERAGVLRNPSVERGTKTATLADESTRERRVPCGDVQTPPSSTNATDGSCESGIDSSSGAGSDDESSRSFDWAEEACTVPTTPSVQQRPASFAQLNLSVERPITVEWVEESETVREAHFSIESPALKRQPRRPIRVFVNKEFDQALQKIEKHLGPADFSLVMEEVLCRFEPAVRDEEGKTLANTARFLTRCVDSAVGPVVDTFVCQGFRILFDDFTQIPVGRETIRVGDMGFSLSKEPAQAVDGGKGKSGTNGPKPKASTSKELPENRGKHKQCRSSKYFSKK